MAAGAEAAWLPSGSLGPWLCDEQRVTAGTNDARRTRGQSRHNRQPAQPTTLDHFVRESTKDKPFACHHFAWILAQQCAIAHRRVMRDGTLLYPDQGEMKPQKLYTIHSKKIPGRHQGIRPRTGALQPSRNPKPPPLAAHRILPRKLQWHRASDACAARRAGLGRRLRLQTNLWYSVACRSVVRPTGGEGSCIMAASMASWAAADKSARFELPEAKLGAGGI